MKVTITLDIPVEGVENLVGFFKVYKQKEGYKEFVYQSELMSLEKAEDNNE